MTRDPDRVTIRPYEPADQPGVEWLYSRTPPWGRTYPQPQPIPPNIRTIAEAFDYAVVAVEQDLDGEAVVGLTTVAAAAATDSVPPPPFIDLTRPVARLHYVLVAPERWRNGIGRRMVHDAIEWSRLRGYHAVVLDTTADQEGAVAFYRALGFREAGRTTFRRWEIIWFELRL
jgi:GNAT superfamily N-acetyltransferase